MSTWSVILAAGRGLRTGSELPKQFLPYRGAPLFWHCARTFARVPGIDGLVFVFPPQKSGGPQPLNPERGRQQERDGGRQQGSADPQQERDRNLQPEPDQTPERHPEPYYEELLAGLEAEEPLGLPFRTAAGGQRRQDSVAGGLAALPRDCHQVLVHDSARPFVSAALTARVLEALCQGHQAVLPGIAVSDTIKEVDEGDMVRTTPERALLRAAQTPQGFALAPLQKAHQKAAACGWQVTDDASLFERLGLPVYVVPGEEGNRKITSAADLALLEERAAPSLLPCTAFGYDVHRYGGARPLILGGVPIACPLTVAAHSDGDVLLHALTDALLGLIGEGDIGARFPDSDPAYDNISSGILLAEVLEEVRARGISLCHADLTVVAQTPRLAPHREAIAANLARLLSLPRHAVNVKATTEEGLGFTGEKKGLKAMAVVSALRPAGPAGDLRGAKGPGS